MKRLATVLLFILAFAMGIVSPSATSWINGHGIAKRQSGASTIAVQSPHVPAMAVTAAVDPRVESKKLVDREASTTEIASREAWNDPLFPGSFRTMTSPASPTLVLHELVHQSHDIRTAIPVRGEGR